jgi:hypothetical protein
MCPDVCDADHEESTGKAGVARLNGNGGGLRLKGEICVFFVIVRVVLLLF